MTDKVKVTPAYTHDGIHEAYRNKSVKKAVELMASIGKAIMDKWLEDEPEAKTELERRQQVISLIDGLMVSDVIVNSNGSIGEKSTTILTNTIKRIAQDLKTPPHPKQIPNYRSMSAEMQSIKKRERDAEMEKIYAQNMEKYNHLDSILIYITYIKKVVYDIFAGKATKPGDDFINTINEQLPFEFDPRVFTTNGVPFTRCFDSVVCIYNEMVNLEHVFYVYMLLTLGQFDKYEGEANEQVNVFLYAFAFVCATFNTNIDVYKYVICHLFKLIRVYFVNSLHEGSGINLRKYFASVGYMPVINDPNLENYGSDRVTYHRNIFGAFSQYPRTEACIETKDFSIIDTLWFAPNVDRGFMATYSQFAERLFDETMNNKFATNLKDLRNVFEYLTNIDILPRSETSYDKVPLLNLRVSMKDEKEIRKYIIKKACEMKPYFKDKISQREMEVFANCQIGLTFVQVEGDKKTVVSKLGGITVAELIAIVCKPSYIPEPCDVEETYSIARWEEQPCGDTIKHTRRVYDSSTREFAGFKQQIEENPYRCSRPLSKDIEEYARSIKV